MGRKIDSERRQSVLNAIRNNDGQLNAAGIARQLSLHPQEVSRVLTSLEDEPQELLCEDDKGFLSFFKR